ncbi:MAG: energy transducer TonB [Deltaproteobacteria bacterium]|nr:energy transducer TonB [Deltaproteobacteria bacterium]
MQIIPWKQAIGLCAGLSLLAGCQQKPAGGDPAATAEPSKPSAPASVAAAAGKAATPTKPRGEPTTSLDVPDKNSMDAPAQNSANPAPAAPDDEGQIYRQVRRQLPMVNACFARQRRVEPDLAGKLTVQVTVGPPPSGSVTTASIVERSFQSPSMESCVVATVKGFAFRRGGGEPLTLTLPFIFR